MTAPRSREAHVSRKNRPYHFYDTAAALCSTCLRQIEAKVVIEAERVLLDKWCPVHGMERVLLADDPEWYRLGREVFVKRPEMPEKFSTSMEYGCPYDCGLCPDHMQHSCLTVVEVTDHCNLRCPTCYAASGPERTTHRPLATVIAMLDAAVRNEGEADVVQISGGEPTLHPDFFAILDAARARPIRHLMVNSNGLRIAQDKDFVARLAEYKKGFEIYLQFDSLQREPLLNLRGADLRSVHDKAIENLNAAGISTTLVMTVKRGVNDGEIGAVLDYARQQPCVRGVTLQPVQEAGRCDQFDSRQHRLTVSELRRRIAEQFPVLSLRDIVPVPCNPDTLAMAYALRQGSELVPLTRYLDYQTLVEGGGNTIAFERDPQLRDKVFSLLSTGHSPESQANCLSDLLCCLPQVAAPSHLGYQDVFRVLIVQFMDAHNLDLRALKKSCVHMVQPDGRMIPFESYNLLYRDERAQTLAKLRSELKAFHQLRLGS